MVGSESPHPYGVFGCTPCHGGRDRASLLLVGRPLARTASSRRRSGRRSTTGSSTGSTRCRSSRSSTRRRAATAATPQETNFPDAPRLDAAMKMVETPRLLGLPPHRGAREAGAAEGRAVAREGRGEGVASDWTTRWVMNPASFRANTQDADLLLPRELRQRLRSRQADARAAADERGGADRERRDGQRDRRVPLREVEAGGGPAGRRPRRRGARPEAARGARLLRLSHARSHGRARPGRDLPAVRAQPRGCRLEGVARLDLPLDPGPEGVESRDQDAEPAPHERGGARHRRVPLAR